MSKEASLGMVMSCILSSESQLLHYSALYRIMKIVLLGRQANAETHCRCQRAALGR